MKALLVAIVAALLVATSVLACTVDVELGPLGATDGGTAPVPDADIAPPLDGGGLPDTGLVVPDAQPASDAP